MGGDVGFDEFAAAAWPRLRRSAYLLCSDDHLAEDLAQTALVRTYARWGRIRRGDALAYARRVLVNHNIDRFRRRHGVTEVGGDALLAADDLQRGDDPDTVADRDHLVRLLGDLSVKERRVVVLRHYFDLSEADTAAELGVSRGTVKSTLSRALVKLRLGLDAERDDLRTRP
ncbi:SigE family RNA polymerase sigma factor [Nocardioides sp. CFH 31398]|uniref:SigE family RNA polymerase sigma factor n=1 Tax=Nocardioides sp. CFH 31398 TaxID=2919579 RepID=UPI001F0644ED|nr:SigE family RNA polymerase sigma factor [Nocardioides sp. CFH 31398]MCH1866389.1 SigE family RNA polymerase sigma factor [Nocardioides sp. CFH 31398]